MIRNSRLPTQQIKIRLRSDRFPLTLLVDLGALQHGARECSGHVGLALVVKVVRLRLHQRLVERVALLEPTTGKVALNSIQSVGFNEFFSPFQGMNS